MFLLEVGKEESVWGEKSRQTAPASDSWYYRNYQESGFDDRR